MSDLEFGIGYWNEQGELEGWLNIPVIVFKRIRKMNKAYLWKNIKQRKRIVKPNHNSIYVAVKLRNDELIEEYNITNNLYERIKYYVLTNKIPGKDFRPAD